jgi:hypothetical protein
MIENKRSIYIRTTYLLSICCPKPFKRTQNYTKEHNEENPKHSIKQTIFNNYRSDHTYRGSLVMKGSQVRILSSAPLKSLICKGIRKDKMQTYCKHKVDGVILT